MKKWILATAIALALAVPTMAADFTQDAAVLNMIGIMEGDGKGDFMPDQYLTRAQFCKMAVVSLGQADQEPLYRNRTVFPDVLSTHWARGYINFAVSNTAGEEGAPTLIRGNADGTFAPDRNITYAESVTILMRMLGYTDLDAGMIWPQGYLDLAAKINLTQGLNLTANQAMTRRQAASLFCNLLNTPEKNGSAFYTTLGAPQANIIITNPNAIAEDGTPGALGTSAGSFKLKNGSIPQSFLGLRGTLLTDEQGYCIAFLPQGKQTTLSVQTVQARWLTDSQGTKYILSETTPVYTAKEDVTTYGELWVDIQAGASMTLYFSATGEIEALYLGGSAQTSMAIATSTANPFQSLVGSAINYTIYRDGHPAAAADIALYDVGIYDAMANTLTVSSKKLTGIYENVSPNLASPSKVTVLGATLTVLPQAMDDLAKFKLGSSITLLLTADNQVAGAVSSATCQAENVGSVTSAETVQLLNGLTVKGTTKSTPEIGDLVKVTSTKSGQYTTSNLSKTNVTTGYDKDKATVGNYSLTKSCLFYEKAGASPLTQLTQGEILADFVSKEQIAYVHLNSESKVDVIVFENLTGNLYTYGLLKSGEILHGGYGSMSYSNRTIYVENQSGDGEVMISGQTVDKTTFAGVVPSQDTIDGVPKVASVVLLTQGTTVPRSAFTLKDGIYYVTSGSQTFQVAENVQCYNEDTGTWFETLAQARGFSDEITLYYDKPASQGGQIRLISAAS